MGLTLNMRPTNFTSSIKLFNQDQATNSTAMEPPPQATPSPAVRVLSRAPPPKPSPAPATGPNPGASPSSHDGVVAVGFVGAAGSARISDRILDAHVFSPGGSARSLAGGVRYHRDGDGRMVFLHLTPLDDAEGDPGPAELPQMLFIFSVCHIIIFLQDGFTFNTQVLKKFRLLQSSKHAFAPFVTPLVTAAMPAKTADTPKRATHKASSNSPPARRGGHNSRHSSAISLVSGTASNHSVLPGQCVPVLLFVFVDDAVDISTAVSSLDDNGDTSSSTQPSGPHGLSKQGSASKGSGSVVRAANKSEGNSGKKLHSSLEGQIRVLLKKCRILAGMEPVHIGQRGLSSGSHHVPLFSLDTSRAVVLLNRSVSRKLEPLDIIAGLFEDSLSSKSSLDILSQQNNFATNHDDIQLIKDFIFRWSDALRGKGGYSSNATAGSAAGVGMVAAAAAAAAASASAGKKTVNAPDLPGFDKWLSISTSIIAALLNGRNVLSAQSENKTHTSPSGKNDKPPVAGSNVIEITLSYLESNNGLNMKFSLSWCQRVLPAAKDIYLKGLPAFYPTNMHELQLQKALRSFHSMVKGPAVQIFSKKLEDECRTIWESGRQQCDAVSLTGRPCKHRRHGDFSSSAAVEVEQHSSGYVFLHACACGRSPRLREDPFDFEAANVSFNCFSNCEDLLPTLELPRSSDACTFPLSYWCLVRLGGPRYYKPTKGLLQIGFSSKEKYLLRWMVSVGKGQVTNGIRCTTGTSTTRSIIDPQNAPVVTSEVKSVTQAMPQNKSAKLQNSVKQHEMESVNSSGIHFGKGLPNFTMKKPFAEVVAATTAKDSEFPALQHTRLLKAPGRKDERQTSVAGHSNGRGHAALSQGPVAQNEGEKVSRNKSNENAGVNPYLQVGSNIVPMIVGNGTRETNQPIQQFSVYIGFEHECPYGHRFLLSEKHLNELNSSSLQYQRHYPNKEAESKHAQKLLQNASGLTATTVDINSGRKNNKAFESSVRNSEQQKLQPRVDPVASQPSPWHSDPQNEKRRDHSFQSITIDDGGEAFLLMNKNLPIYMHCPHCKNSERKGHQDLKFAGAVSQLQRIFIITPDFPVLLASCPLVQFEGSCLPSNIFDSERQGLFSIGCQVILPPESFLTMRLPFIYGVETREGSTVPLKHFEQQPELTAWLVGGTALQIVSVGNVTEKETNVK